MEKKMAVLGDDYEQQTKELERHLIQQKGTKELSLTCNCSFCTVYDVEQSYINYNSAKMVYKYMIVL